MKIIVCTRDLDYGAGSNVKTILGKYDKNKRIKEVLVIAPKKIMGYSNKIKFLTYKSFGNLFITNEPLFAFKLGILLKKIVKGYDRIETHHSFFSNDYSVPLNIRFHLLHRSIIKNFPKTPKFLIGAIFHRIYSYFDYRTIKYASKVFFVSKRTMNEAIGFYPQFKDKFYYVPNIIDEYKFPSLSPKEKGRLKKELDLNDGKKNILYVGRLESFKGVNLLIDAIKRIDSDNIRLIVIGDGPLKKEILKYNFVKFLGKISNDQIYKYYNVADLFVLPSFYENCSITLLEALSCKSHILASNVGDNEYYLDTESLFDIKKSYQLKTKIKEKLNLK